MSRLGLHGRRDKDIRWFGWWSLVWIDPHVPVVLDRLIFDAHNKPVSARRGQIRQVDGGFTEVEALVDRQRLRRESSCRHARPIGVNQFRSGDSGVQWRRTELG